MKIFFAFLFLLIAVSSFGKKIYTIPKDDFVKQFGDASAIEKIYCYSNSGDKFWVIVQQYTILVLNQNDGKQKKLVLAYTKYKDGIIETQEFNSWSGRNKNTSTFNLSDVASFEVEVTVNESVLAYFDDDSCRSVWKFRNDSLQHSYITDSQYVIHLLVKKSSDTLTILEDACYNMKFKDGNEVMYGVVQKVTPDSFYISNRFNRKAAEVDKVEYKVYGFTTKDILELRLLHSGGFPFKKKDTSDWDVVVVKDSRSRYYPCGFTKYKNSCEIGFVRWWLTNNGFKLVYESGGKIYWWGA